MEPLERARELFAAFESQLRSEMPEGVDVFDAHTHLGTDIDGMVGRYEELEAMLDRHGISRCFVFCLDEPDRHPAFRAGNDRTLAFAERSQGRMIPFVRLALDEEPIAEATRCLDLGARGIKLHPRAQKFLLDDERLTPVFALAAERSVPILIHGGRGLPPIADHLHRLVDAYPEAQLIIAHAGIADMANLTARFAGVPGVFFDTSTWSAVDLLDFYRQVAPEQVVWASDFPYGQQPGSLLIAIKTALVAGYDESQLRGLLGGTAGRLADGEELPEPTSPLGSGILSRPMQLARIHQYLAMTTPLLWTRQADTLGVLGLAINACLEPNGSGESSGRILELLIAARDVWTAAPEIVDDQERVRAVRLTFRLIHLADIEAVTAAA